MIAENGKQITAPSMFRKRSGVCFTAFQANINLRLVFMEMRINCHKLLVFRR